MNFLKQLTWQAVAVILGGGAIFTVIAIFAPPDARTLLLGANGLVCTLIGLANDLRKPTDPDKTPTEIR